MRDRDFTLADVLRGVWNRKLLALGVFIMTVFLVGIATLACPKSYISSATFFVRLGRENVGLDATATLGEKSIPAIPSNREAEINSIAGLIAKKNLLEQVVDQVGPLRILKRGEVDSEDVKVAETSPGLVAAVWEATMETLMKYGVVNDVPLRERAIIKLQKSIEVQSLPKTNLVSISFESHSPEVAQQVVRLLTAAYVQDHCKLNRTSGAYDFLSQQTDSVRQELESAEEQLLRLKQGSGILESEKQREILVERNARLRDELMRLEANSKSLHTEVASLERKLDSMSETTIIESRTGAGNDGADGMRQQLFALEMQREKLVAERSASHPIVKQLDVQLASVKKKLATEEANRKETVIGPNPVYDKTNAELILKRAELAANDGRKEIVLKQLAKVEAEAQTFSQREVEYARLGRQIAISDENYRKYAQNMLQAKIDNELERNQISNIKIAQPATYNVKPSFPNKLVNLILALALGIVNAVGVAALLEYRKLFVRESKRSKTDSSSIIDEDHVEDREVWTPGSSNGSRSLQASSVSGDADKGNNGSH